jgi:hypothetical protein
MGRAACRIARGPLAMALLLAFAPRPTLHAPPPLLAQESSRASLSRFTVEHSPRDRHLAQVILREASRRDTFPGLPRPSQAVTIVLAANRAQFRALIGPYAPEWGAAIAMPSLHRIVMQGQRAGSDAGDPLEVLRHELAHLALHEALGDLPPRWFDEGYASFAAGEWSREEVLATNLALAFRGAPTFERLEDAFSGGSGSAQQAYALAYRAVAELAALDPQRGLSGFFVEWRRTRSLDRAVRTAYGITLGGFEARWQRRTRRRYGVIAIAAELTVVTTVLLMVILPFYIARRRRDRERMNALVAADRTADARTDEALAAFLADSAAEEEGDRRGARRED